MAAHELRGVGGGRAGVVAVASASPGDGKSTIVANLAVALAADGERVVVVEADLRRPSLHSTVLGEGLERRDRGLVDHLRDGTRQTELITAHRELPGVFVMWAGQPPSHPSRHLRSSALKVLLLGLRSEFDRVIVDTPPISVGTDAALVAAAADATLLVIDQRRTTLPAVRVGLDKLRVTGANVVGVVLNHASMGTSDGYYAPAPAVVTTESRDVRRV